MLIRAFYKVGFSSRLPYFIKGFSRVNESGQLLITPLKYNSLKDNMTKFILCNDVTSKENEVLVNIDNINYIYNENGKVLITDKNKNKFYPCDENLDFIHFVAIFSVNILTGK